MSRTKVILGWWAAAVLASLLVSAAAAHGQATPSAEGGGHSLWLGAEYGNLRAGFPNGSDLRLSGAGVFATYNWNHQFALEGHARFLNLNSWYGETEQDYLVGPRYTFLHDSKWRPFAAFDVGVVKILYPFNVGTGTSFAMAPGGGLEYRVDRKWSVRGTYEYQLLPNSPNFTNEPKYGIRPNGFSAGISYRLF